MESTKYKYKIEAIEITCHLIVFLLLISIEIHP